MRSIAALSTIFAVTSSLGGNSLLASNGFHSYSSHQTFPSNGEDITYYGLFCVVSPGYVSVLNMNITVSVLTSIARDNFWGECVKYGFIEEKNIQLF